MSGLALVMPMAGRGSRFAQVGHPEPKPLIDLHGRPFFWWATESLRRLVPLREMVYVVLEEHCRRFDIEGRIRHYYPRAGIVVIADVTSGAAETARLGLQALQTAGPVAINDCDHAFVCPSIASIVPRLGHGMDAALLCFRADSPAYSYARVDPVSGQVLGTVEKQVVSPFAIAGCYFIADAGRFETLYADYVESCPYQELFMSGIFNLMIERGGRVGRLDAQLHRSFGTPDEHALARASGFDAFEGWE